MKSLYEAAIQLINQISSIKHAIKVLGSEGEARVVLRADAPQSDVYLSSSVRPSAYAQFLNGELKDLEKSLKVIEHEIKSKIH